MAIQTGRSEKDKEIKTMSYVRFRANIPEELTLKYRAGREVDNKFGGGTKQVMFTLEDGRKVYLHPNEAATIKNLGIRKGERFSICKREVIDAGRPKIQWEIKRMDAAPLQAGAEHAAPDCNRKTKAELMNELG